MVKSYLKKLIGFNNPFKNDFSRKSNEIHKLLEEFSSYGTNPTLQDFYLTKEKRLKCAIKSCEHTINAWATTIIARSYRDIEVNEAALVMASNLCSEGHLTVMTNSGTKRINCKKRFELSDYLHSYNLLNIPLYHMEFIDAVDTFSEIKNEFNSILARRNKIEEKVN